MNTRSIATRNSAVTVILLAIGAVVASAQPTLQPGTTIPVTAHVEPSPAAQLRYCNHLARRVYDASSDADRLTRLAEVTVDLGMIPKVWPHDRVAVLESYLLAADLDLFAHAPRNAQETMMVALPIAGSTEYTSLVERRLGAAYAALGDNVNAEAHFVAAQAPPGFARLNAAEREKTLRQIASFFTRTGKPAEAAARYRALANLPDARPISRAADLLASAKQSALLRDEQHAAAFADLAAFTHAASQARGVALSADENMRLNHLESDAARLQQALHHH